MVMGVMGDVATEKSAQAPVPYARFLRKPLDPISVGYHFYLTALD
jgi:hypothetical protein